MSFGDRRDPGRRLPTLGAAPVDEAALAVPLEDRRAPPVPLVAIASAVPTAAALPFACLLADALARRGVPPALMQVRRARGAGRLVVVRDHSGTPSPEGAGDPVARLVTAAVAPVVRLDADAGDLPSRLEAAFERVLPSPLLIAVGNDVPVLYHTRLTVMVTAGVAPPAWSAGGRALRDRVDLELADPRPGVAEGLAQELAGR